MVILEFKVENVAIVQIFEIKQNKLIQQFKFNLDTEIWRKTVFLENLKPV